MELKEIKKVADAWSSATWKVIEFENPGFDIVRKLYQDTYEIIEVYRKDELVPKEVSRLLLEMHDFSWWVGDLEETPLHCCYQDIISLTGELKGQFLSGSGDTEKIKTLIDGIIG